MGKPIFRYHKDIWVEKYRPKKMEEYITTSDMKERFDNFISQQNIPHLLFEGPPGTGKSSLANLLVTNLECDVKYINAAENNGIDTVRDEIMKYCVASSFERIKVMVLDEFSEFTPQGQLALNAVMEQYSQHVRFILTCNNVDNIIEKIRSRCQEFRIVPPTQEQVKLRCEYILKSEKVDFDEEDLEHIVRHNYPDIRKVIQYLDQQSVGGKLRLDKEFYKVLRFEQKVIESLKSTNSANVFDKAKEIRQTLADTRVKNFVSLYKYLFQKVDEYAPAGKVFKIIFNIQEGLKTDATIADKEMNMVATILRIMETLI
jgi:replication factor C small subunit